MKQVEIDKVLDEVRMQFLTNSDHRKKDYRIERMRFEKVMNYLEDYLMKQLGNDIKNKIATS